MFVILSCSFRFNVKSWVLLVLTLLALWSLGPAVASAASLAVLPNTGVYQTGNTFTVRVTVNTAGASINAAEGTIKFNPQELSVVSVNRAGSIFSLWVAEPSFSNHAGTVSFSGGSPAGYTGSSGTIMTVTFRAKGSGITKATLSKGSVLASDGRGTNVLTAMSGGTYTMQAPSTAPEPEIIEYVAPANTPDAPKITSVTHPSGEWSNKTTAELAWNLPADVTAIRTLLDSRPDSVPTKVYTSPMRSLTIPDLADGVSYVHVQFKNADGWGNVAHYKLAVDTNPPSAISIATATGTVLSNPQQTVLVAVENDGAPIKEFVVQIDAVDAFTIVASSSATTSELTLPPLTPGYHTISVEAIDAAGQSVIGLASFEIISFAKPVFTEYPAEIDDQVIPVIKGLTRPNAKVDVLLRRVGGEPTQYTVPSDAVGEFIFIPEGTFYNGVYEISAQATDEYGAQSNVSDVVRIAVQERGYLKLGNWLVSVLSVVVPLVLMVLTLCVALWYFVVFMRRFRRRVRVESREALTVLRREFTTLDQTLTKSAEALATSRKTKKLTKAEAELVEALGVALKASKAQVEKEITDVTNLTKRIHD